MLRKIFYVILVLAIMVSISACSRKDKKADSDITNKATYSTGTIQNSNTDTEVQSSNNTGDIPTTATPQGNNPDENQKEQLLQSASVDLDNDGTNEEVEALKVEIKGQSENDPGELEGILKITSAKGTKKIPFIKKQAGLTDVMSGFEFVDLDGDGAKDIFIVLPDSGAAFSLNYFYIYNYKKEKSYSFTSDSSLAEFANSFKFQYKGNGKLELINNNLGFKSVFDISEDSGFESDDENNKSYENAWVEPTPVEISPDSRITIEKDNSGAYEIKVPLPVFGLATVDMIGEVDLYYRVDGDFFPILKHFTVYDFKNDGKNIIGKCNIK
jgi:hypothetical protein